MLCDDSSAAIAMQAAWQAATSTLLCTHLQKFNVVDSKVMHIAASQQEIVHVYAHHLMLQAIEPG